MTAGEGYLSRFRFPIYGLGLVALAGCRSHVVDITIVNHGPALRVVEFDYPNASFGVNQLASGGRYQYRIQVQGSGTVSLQYEGASGHKSYTGPKVNLGDQGSLLVDIDPGGAVTWRRGLAGSK